MPERKSESGVTLLELLVVIAILAILADLAISGWQSMLSGQASLRELQSVRIAAQTARDAAMLTGTPVVMNLSGCSVATTYSGRPPSGAPALPSVQPEEQGSLACSPNATLEYVPDGLLLDVQTQNPAGITWSCAEVNGSSVGTLVLHAGGAIDVAQ